MPLTLAILGTPSSASIVAGQSVTLVAAVTNAGAASVTLNSLVTSTDGTGSVSLTQPDFLTPNQPVGVGNPVLLPGATSNYAFRVVYLGPTTAGPSPQSPGGASGFSGAYPNDTDFGVTLTSFSSDGTVAQARSSDPVLSTLLPFPVAQGGALQLASGFNVLNLLVVA